MFRAGSAITWSSNRIEPASGLTKPAIMLSVVVLPQPDGPRTAVILPSSKVTEMSRTAGTAPNCLRSRSSVIAGIVNPPCAPVGCSRLSGSSGRRRRAPHHLQPQFERAAPVRPRDPLRGIGIAFLDRAQQIAAKGDNFLGAPGEAHGRHPMVADLLLD